MASKNQDDQFFNALRRKLNGDDEEKKTKETNDERFFTALRQKLPASGTPVKTETSAPQPTAKQDTSTQTGRLRPGWSVEDVVEAAEPKNLYQKALDKIDQAKDKAEAARRFGNMSTEDLFSYVPTSADDKRLYETYMGSRLEAAKSLERQSKQAKNDAAKAGNQAEAYREFLGMPGASDEEIFGLAQAVRENNAQAKSLEPQRWLEYAEGLQESQQKKQSLTETGNRLQNRANAASEQGQAWEYSNVIKGYGELINSPDFDKKSQYNPNESHVIYRAINGDAEARNQLLDRGSKSRGFSPVTGENNLLGYRGAGNDYLFELTDTEKGIYNALYSSSPEAANNFVEKLKPYLEVRSRDAFQSYAAAMAQRYPGLSSAATIPAGALQSGEYITQIGDLIRTGEINQNSANYRASQMSNTVRGEVSKIAESKWGKVGSAAYNLGMSMGDFLFGTAAGGGTKALSLALMGTRVAASTVLNLKDRGLDDASAFTLGTIAGAAEIVTESFSLEQLLNPDLIADGIAKNILKNFLAEASEEGASDIINWAAERIYDAITGNNAAEWKQQVYDAIQNGADPNDAVLAAIQDNLVQLGTDMLGGGISGGIMSAAGTPLYLNQFNNSQQGQYANAIRGNEEGLQALIEQGLQSPQNTESYQRAQDVLKQFADGKTPSALSVARLVDANQQQIDNETAEQSGRGRLRLTLPRTVQQNPSAPTPEQIERLRQIGAFPGEANAAQASTPSAVQETQTNRTGGRSDAEKAAALQRAYEAERNIVEQQSPERQRFLKRAYSMIENELKSLAVGDRLVDENGNTIATVVSTGNGGITLVGDDYMERIPDGTFGNSSAIANDLVDGKEYRLWHFEKASQEPAPVPQETRNTPGLTLPARTTQTTERAAETPRLTLPTQDTQAATEAPTTPSAEQVSAFDEQAESELVERLAKSKPGLMVDDYARSKLSENEIRAIDETARRLGLRVAFVDKVRGGKDNARIYDSGVVLIEKGNWNPIGYLYGHEMSHWLQQNSPEAYSEFAEAARATDPEWFKAKEEEYNTVLRESGEEMSPEEIQEEILCDYAGWLVYREDVLNRFIEQNKEKPNVLRRLYEAIKALAARLTGKEKQKADTAADLLLKAMNATEASVQNGIMSTGETRSSTKYGNENPGTGIDGTADNNYNALMEAINNDNTLRDDQRNISRGEADALRRIFASESVKKQTDRAIYCAAVRRAGAYERVRFSEGPETLNADVISDSVYTREMQEIASRNKACGYETRFFIDNIVYDDGESRGVDGLADTDNNIIYVKANPKNQNDAAVQSNSLRPTHYATYKGTASDAALSRHERLHMILANPSSPYYEQARALLDYVDSPSGEHAHEFKEINFWYQRKLRQYWYEYSDYSQEIACDIYAGALLVDSKDIASAVAPLVSAIDRAIDGNAHSKYSLKGINADIAPASVQKSAQMPARQNDRVERMKFKYEQAIEEQKGKTFQANAQRNSDLARQKREFQERMAAQRERESERRERTTFKHEQKVEEVKGKLFQEKARRYSELAKQKREFQEKEAKGKEERRARELREKIATHTKRLLAEYQRPNDKHHVPEGLRGAVNAVLSSINMSSGYSLAEDGEGGQLHIPIGEGVAETKRTQAFAQLRSELEKERERLVLDWSMIDDPDGALNKLVGEMADTPIANMDSEQLRSVYDVLRNVEHAIKTADKMLSQARWDNVSNFANALRDENVGKNQPLQLNGKLGNVLKHARLDILTPEAYFHRLGDSGKAVFKMLRGGQDSYIRNITDAVNTTKDILKGADVRKLETDKHTVTLGGKEVTMSTAQLMELYCLMQRDQGMQHISTGGVVVEPGRGVKKTTQLDPIHPTEQELNDAIDQLTQEQIRMAEAMQGYLTKDMSDLGNEATMQVYGYKKFGNEDNYWKIRSNKNELQSTVEKDTQTTSVANKGFTKATKPNANTSVLIGSAFDTFSQSVSDMATYSAWLAISEDLNRIRNYTFRDENGNRVTTMQTILDRVHGDSGANYFKQLMADIANGTQNDAGLTEGFVGAYKAAAIGANIRVIAQQPTAILRALEMIDPKYFANAKDPFKAFERAKKYAPIAQWKDWGYFDINTGRKMKDVLMESAETPLEKARQGLMSPAGKADSWAWGVLWNAVERETEKTTSLTPGSDEFYQHCAERFSDIIDHTQVVDGIIQRSPIQRSKNSINKMASSFMSEPLKQYAQFMSAVYDVKNGKKGAGKHLVRTTVAMAAAGLLNNAVQSLVDALRDDDKEKKYWEKFLEKFLGYNSDDDTIRKKIKTFLGSNMGELVNPAEYIPYAKDIMSIYKGYDVERMDMSLVADLVTAVNRLQNTLAGDTKYTAASAVASVTEQLAKLTGLPAANIDRDIKSILNTVANEADIPLLQYYLNRYQFKPAKSGNLSKDLVNILWSAKQKGEDDYQAVYDRLIKDGYDEDKISSAMLSKLSETTGLTQAIKDADAAGNANGSYDTREILSAFETLDLSQDDADALLEWKLSDNQWENYNTLKDADIDYDTRLDIMQRYNELNTDKELRAGDKALEFSRYVDSLNLTSEQTQLVKDTYKFWSQVPAEAARYETFKQAGLDEDKSKHTSEVLGALEPLPGKEDVTDMQRYRAIESDKELTDAEKIKVIGSIMGPELKTEQGNPTQWAKFQRAVNDGVGIGKALDLVEHDSLDIYVKMKSAGMPSNSAVTVSEGLKELKPLPGKEDVTAVQRYRKIASMSSVSADDKLKAIGAYMGTEMKTENGNPSQWAKFNMVLDSGMSLSKAIDIYENERLDVFEKWTTSAAKGQNVSWDVYDKFRKDTANFDGKDENDESVSGLLKERVVAYIEALDLTIDQKKALLKDYSKTYKDDITWHNGSYGPGYSKTYAKANLSRLELPRTTTTRQGRLTLSRR